MKANLQKNLTVLTGLLLAVFCGVARAEVLLVQNGQPLAEIVVAVDSARGTELAAEDLQEHIAAISGATLPIVNSPSSEVKYHVYVGESTFTHALGFRPAVFNNSGFEILVKEDYIILDGPVQQWKESPFSERMSIEHRRYLNGSAIAGDVIPKPADFPPPSLKAWQDFCGEKFSLAHVNNAPGSFNEPLGIYVNDDTGPWYAVTELLEQFGVRWYMPYDDGTVIPEKKDLSVPEQHLTKEAKYAKREWCYYGTMRSDAEGIKWFKRQKAGNYRIALLNHTTYAIYSSYEQQLLHPEYLACDANGKPYLGYPTGAGMPRFSDPGFRQASVTFMNKVFESQPDLSAMTVGPPDGGVKMDARDVDQYGKPSDTIIQRASQYMWDFHVYLAQELKKSHPDKFLIYMTGAGANEIPNNIEEFPENLLVRPRLSPASMWGLNTYRNAQLANNQLWLDKMQVIEKAPSWDHWLSYRTTARPRYPVFFTRALQRQMQEVLSYCDGKFIEIQPESHRTEGEKKPHSRLGMRGLVHLMVYWQNKLFWDPDTDRAQMLQEYYRLFFGPAEQEMRTFYEFAEEVWSRQESRSLTESTGFLKEADVDRFFALLTAAREKAGAGTVYDRRVEQIESEMVSIKKLFPNLKRIGPSIRLYSAPDKVAIDGDLSEYKYGWATLRDNTTGETPKKNRTSVVLAMMPNNAGIIIGAVCYENRMDSLKADCSKDDDFSIFQDDVIEIYLNSPERSYFKIVVNPNAAVWDETTDVAIIDRDTLPVLWNPGVKAVVKKLPDRWIVEILIPTQDLGKLGPTADYPWGIEVGRTRFTGGVVGAWALAPTSGAYATPNRWANLWMR